MGVALVEATQNSWFLRDSQNGNDIDVTPKNFHRFSLYSKSAVNSPHDECNSPFLESNSHCHYELDCILKITSRFIMLMLI